MRKCPQAETAKRWNAKAGKVIDTKEDVKVLNTYLENMKAEVYAAHNQLNVDGSAITADSVKCKFLGKAEKTHTIMEPLKSTIQTWSHS